jgi:putative PEP-CTERM system TPR-repeat lipoprotein
MNKSHSILFFIFFISTCCNTHAEQLPSSYENTLTFLQQGKLNEAEIAVKNSIQQRPNYLPSRLLLGDILLQKGQPQSAEKELAIALSLQADSFAVILPLVKAKLFLYKHDDALDLLNQYPQLATENEYFLLQGNAYKGLNQSTLANKSYQQSINIHGETLELFIAMADLSFKEGKLDSALTLVNKAISLKDNHQGALMLKAEILKNTDNFDDALEIYTEMLQKEPTNKQSLFGKATILLELNQLNSALSFSLTLRENFPNDPYIKLLHSSIIALQGNEREARTLLRDIQQQFMNLSNEHMQNREVLLLSASVDYLNENYHQARRQFLLYLSDYEENVVAYRHLTMIALKENNLTLAQQYVDKALTLSPNEVDIHLLASHIYQQQFDKNEYLSFIEKAQSTFPDNTLLRDQYIGALISVNRSNDAVALLNKTSSSSTLANKTLLGFLQLQTNNIEQAKITTQTLLDENPNKVEILQLAGELSLKLGRDEDSIKLFKQALILDDTFRPALLALAGISLNKKDEQQTEYYYQQLLTLYPNDVLVLQLYADFAIKQQQLFLAIKLLSQIPKGHIDFMTNQRALLKLYLENNQLANAEKTLQLLEEFFLFDQELLLAKSKLQKQQGKTAKSSKTLKILFGLIYDDVAKIETLSNLQIDIADIEAAKRSIDRIRQLSSGKISPYIETRFALVTQDTKKANQLIEQQLLINPEDPTWIELKIHLLLTENNMDQAIDLLRPLYQSQKNREHMQLLAQLYSQKKNLAALTLLLQEWIAQQSSDAWAVSQLSTIALNNGDTALAISTLENYVHINQQPIFLNNLANLYQENDPKKALVFAKKAYELAPTLAAINDTLGWLFVKNNQPQTGLSYLRESIARDVNNPNYHYHLAYTLAILKRIPQAKAALLTAQKLALDHELTKKINLLINKD